MPGANIDSTYARAGVDVGWWMAGAALGAMAVWSIWDVGRPGHASRAALVVLRAVGGLGLLALAAQALNVGATWAAALGGTAALALILGLFHSATARGRERVHRLERPATRVAGQGEAAERRAA